MKKVVINKCFGGFSLSPVAVLKYAKLSGFNAYPYANTKDENGNSDFNKYKRLSKIELKEHHFCIHWVKNDLGEYTDNNTLNEEGDFINDRDIERDNPNLVAVVESLGEKANGSCAELGIVEIPEDVNFEIEEYDGNEHIAESHRTWY